jgi:NAD(P)-dependent dehydrogenase (short-subunit alcohol dehydrogenase family)
MAGRLDGKVALITGTGGGQGRAAAELFCAEGARVVGCDLNERALATSGSAPLCISRASLMDDDRAKPTRTVTGGDAARGRPSLP